MLKKLLTLQVSDLVQFLEVSGIQTPQCLSGSNSFSNVLSKKHEILRNSRLSENDILL